MTSKKPRPSQSLNRAAEEREPGFNPRTLDRAVIAIPLLLDFEQEKKKGERIEHGVVIDLHLEFPGGRDKARKHVESLVAKLPPRKRGEPKRHPLRHSSQYLYAKLYADEIRQLVKLDQASSTTASTDKRKGIFRIWPDFKVKPLLVKSVSTVKADAAHSSFAAFGENIVWAVVDSGIDGKHAHFEKHDNLDLGTKLDHYDFTLSDPLAQPASRRSALKDEFGHGTHVAGIIAGALTGKKDVVRAAVFRWTEEGVTEAELEKHDGITGMAPKCKIVSMKVLDDEGAGTVFPVIQALDRIQEINGHGRRILIHGVNLSVGYDFEPEWFACGMSPLCVEVDRLVRSGVVVVVAAGNTGFGIVSTESLGDVKSGLALSINDPGNAELAITVGSTHRDMPHTYGVSYFSSKGPTGDGRPKPDLLAPGEKILSCAAGAQKAKFVDELSKKTFEYMEQSGTSMAAPHVSGVIAAFLSIRRE
ncbi:MAG: S8 family peptidase, partial [Gemmatimonadaceae bacterium]